MQSQPRIIQGGMGIAVSQWQLARAVSKQGELGVVSGTGIGIVLARRLQNGDPGGHMRRALAHFPVPAIAQRVLSAYYLAGGKQEEQPFKCVPLFTLHPRRDLLELVLCANFAEVWLAKEGHDGRVGINLLEKIQLPHLVSLYGAMLAGVDVVLMGAGIPLQIPGVLDSLAHHERVTYRLDVSGALPDERYEMTFNPHRFVTDEAPPLKRPDFFAIVSSATLARMLATKASGTINGFVVEGPTAGGHNAPPRGKMQLNERGEPVYGPRDALDLEALKDIGLPFWLAGSLARPARLREALSLGAAGIQAGTIFALCEESGLVDTIRREIRRRGFEGTLDVFTDPMASPTSYPFKIAQLPETLADPATYARRPRHCDIGRLRQVYRRDDGTVGYRCPAEPVEDYLKKGGQPEETEGRKCLCNALMANIGLPQTQRNGYVEAPLITLGDDVGFLTDLLPDSEGTYTAAEAIRYLRNGLD